MSGRLSPSRVVPALKRRGTRLLSDLRWLVLEAARAPRFEAYAWREDRKNRRFFREVRAGAGKSPWLRPFEARSIPKILWIYWAQGEAEAPHVVQRCLESWRRLNPDWDVRVLDTATAAELVDLSDVPDFLPHRSQADMLRLRLLKRFGGVWADATVLCHRPLDEWLPLQAMSGFFVFANPGPDRWLDTWFIASEAEGTLISAWEDAYRQHVERCTRMPRRYFMVMYVFQWRVLKDPAARAAWERTATLPAPPTFLLMAAIGGSGSLETAKAAIRCGLPLSKLSWKTAATKEEMDDAIDVTATAARTVAE